GLDQQDVDAAGQQPGHLGLVAVAQADEVHLAQRGQLGAGADRPDDPPGPVGRGVAGGDLSGDAGGRPVEFEGAIGDAVFGQNDGKRPEGVGLHRVDTDLEEAAVQVGDDPGTGQDQHLVTALQGGTA